KDEIDSLIAEDDAVILDHSIICKTRSKNRLEVKHAVKILLKNNKAEKYGTINIRESEYVETDDIKAVLTDIMGNEIKKLDDDDIKESSISSYSILHEKDKVKYFQLLNNKFPFILEFSYKQDIESLFFWPDWKPQKDIPVLKSSYKLIMDHSYPFKTYAIGMDIQPEISVEDGDSVYYWAAENIPPKVDEDFLPPENELQMALLFAPERFEISDSRGSTKSWKEFGKWSWELNKDRFNLSPEARAEIKNMIEGLSDPYEKIRVLYNYLQNSTRYVAIELGLGGWQPYPAEDTFENRYGDCKDLSTLMVAMLKVAGINAYTADALTRNKGVVIEEFPSDQFNHVIAFVPLDADTLWLECTADFLDIHDMPYTIEGINALVIKEDGGELIHTPTAPSWKNKWVSKTKADIHLSATEISVNCNVETSGKQKRFFKGLYEYADSEDEKIVLQKIFSDFTPNLTISDYEFNEVGNEDVRICVNFNGVYKKSFAKSGSRIFLNPNLFNRKTSSNMPDEEVGERKFPIHFHYPYQDFDSVQINIPFGYDIESAPEPVLLETSFARYRTNYEFKDQHLSYSRSFEYKTNHFKKELYSEFVDFLKKVIKNDNAKFVFKR
ncbi:MAG: DUF3857 domain-containing protein, partial [Calditrichaceae bacterium]